ncbi:MAG TPA: excinuclease ABC subunit UvrC [Chloroflexia bacterium]|nr:excinuclease ABC subunit UvrC [Chloroflexia bacterium]
MAIFPSIPPRERAPGFEERLRALPGTPGVYIMHNRADDIIYVGKAVSLKNRVRSYFGSLKGQAPKVMRMVDEVFDFEYILTDTELEALILENQLIKKHRPRYNIKLKDDKTYPYIKVTTNEAWPRVLPTRRVLNDGAQYFGPFPGMGTVYQTLDLLDKLFPFRTCDKEITGNDARPCVQYFIHRCLGPCAGLADKPAYDDAIKQVVLFLNRKHDIIIRNLKSKMGEAAENLEFERAAVFRDRIRSLERVLEEQKVFSATKTDEDVIAFARNDGEACVQIFFIRGGKLLGREHYMLEGTADSTPGEILESFMTQFYDDASYVPPKVVLQDDVSDAEIIESWLRVRRGTKVTLSVPRRGQKRDMVEMAARNAAETLEQFRLRWLSDEQKSTAALTELQALLRLPVWPQRIECYDVAHLQGTDVAGAMVVFEQGMPKKKEYRRFNIKSSGNDDFASMREMLARRFRRASAEHASDERKQALSHAEAGERDEPAPSAEYEAVARIEAEATQDRDEPQLGDTQADLSRRERAAEGRNGSADGSWEKSGWAVLPDLVVIDGGKGQLNVAYELLTSVGLRDVPLISLAKREEEVFLPGRSEPVVLDVRSEALKLLQRIRDEAHRFSNSYNKKLGSKRGTKSKLDEVPLIGPVRKKALYQKFGSLKGMREASIEELMSVKGMDRAAAQSIKEHL